MTGQELLDYQRTAAVNAGFNPDDPNSKYYVPKELVTRPLTNWLKEMLRVGILQEYEINASAGNDRGKFYSSFNYQKNNGIARGIDFQKFTARVNSDYKLTKTLSIGTRVNLAYQESNDIPMQDLYYSNPIFAGMAALPWTPFYDEDGNYNVYISELSNKRVGKVEDVCSEGDTMYVKCIAIDQASGKVKLSRRQAFEDLGLEL